MSAILRSLPLLLLLAAAAAPQAAAQAPRVVLFEDPALPANRLHYPLLISQQRGYRILCASQHDEEAVIRGLGFTTVPAEVLSVVDPDVVAAEPAANPFLCPTSPDFSIRVFAHDGGAGMKYYLQFPTEPGADSVTGRLYTPGCVGLVEALNLDLDAAMQADPTPFFQGKIHNIACISGLPPDPAPASFTAWCTKSDRSARETATVMALLDATPGGVSALGNPAACATADGFLTSITSINLNGRAVQDLAPLKVLPHLTSLSLADNEITDIAALSGLRALTFLDFSGNRIVSLAALAPMSLLNRLDVSDNEITDVRSLSSLAGMTELTLDGNQIADLSPLQFLQALSTLSIARNGLNGDQLEPLTALGALTSLDLSFNQIETFETLGSFSSTVEIDLTGNPIVQTGGQNFVDLCILHRDAATPLGQTVRVLIEAGGGGTCESVNNQLSAQTTLSLETKIISDVRPIALLSHLTGLDLSDNAITDIAPLGALVNLTSLQLTDNDIVDITPISPLTKLTSFDASGNPIVLDNFLTACLMRNHVDQLAPAQSAEVDALLAVSAKSSCHEAQNTLKALQGVTAGNRGLTTIAYFKVLENATSVNLSDNSITDFSDLDALPGLRQLRINNNPLTSIVSLMPLRRLEHLSMSGTQISSLSGIANLNKLRTVFFSNTGVRSVRPLMDLPLLEDAAMRNLPLTYNSFVEYCLVNRFDSIALGADRAFMTALDTRLQTAQVDTTDCEAAEDWVRSITVLNLNKKTIASVKPIVFFTALQELHLFDNLISDALPIASLTHLKKLNLATNRLQAIPRFGSTGLTRIYLDGNSIRFVPQLSNMPSLSYVGLKDNRLRNAQPLTTLPALDSADLRDNLLQDNNEVPQPLWAKIYLGGNPICGSPLTMHPAIQAACDRTPGFVFVNTDLHIRDVMVLEANRNLLDCPNGPNCRIMRVNPNFPVIINR